MRSFSSLATHPALGYAHPSLSARKGLLPQGTHLKHVIIYTDGSCLGNPGSGGWSAILTMKGSEARKEICGGFSHTTNNRMEILAAVNALALLTEPCEVTLHSDSQYLCNAVQKGWLAGWIRNSWIKSDRKPVKNVDLWMKLVPLLKTHKVTFKWLRGHAGHAENERCDELARGYAARKDLPDDPGYEE